VECAGYWTSILDAFGGADGEIEKEVEGLEINEIDERKLSG